MAISVQCGLGDIVVKLDGDGQMDPRYIKYLVRPILDGRADYAKGNRFFNVDGLHSMPRARLLGNAALSFFSKISSGYWTLFDPTNGFTAINALTLALLPLEKISRRYFFESDMLFRLGIVRACVWTSRWMPFTRARKATWLFRASCFSFCRNIFRTPASALH